MGMNLEGNGLIHSQVLWNIYQVKSLQIQNFIKQFELPFLKSQSRIWSETPRILSWHFLNGVKSALICFSPMS